MRKSVRRRPAPRGAGLYAASGQRKYLNGEERQRFIAAALRATPEVRTLCLTLVHTGCRISECLSLKAADVQAGNSSISVRSLKKRGELVFREIPVPPALIGELAAVHDLADGDALLWPFGRTTAWQMVKSIMAAASVMRLPASPKGLRHGFGVHAMRSGVPINLIQRWMGHKDIGTTAIYLHVIGPEEQEIAARMWRE